MISIGKRIKFMRNKAGLTQKELAEKIGSDLLKTPNRISQYESDYRTPGKNKIKKIAEILQIPPAYLSVPVPSTTEEMDIINYWLSEFPLDSEKSVEYTES